MGTRRCCDVEVDSTSYVHQRRVPSGYGTRKTKQVNFQVRSIGHMSKRVQMSELSQVMSIGHMSKQVQMSDISKTSAVNRILSL